MNEKIKLADAAEQFLQTKKGYKKSWMRSLFGMIIAAIMIGVVMGFSYNQGPLSGISIDAKDYNSIAHNLSKHPDLINSATYICYAVIACFVAPFICGMATWLIGINQVTKSKYFHIFMWTMVLIAIILATIALIMFIRSTIYLPQGVPQDAEASGGESGSAPTPAMLQAIKTALML